MCTLRHTCLYVAKLNTDAILVVQSIVSIIVIIAASTTFGRLQLDTADASNGCREDRQSFVAKLCAHIRHWNNKSLFANSNNNLNLNGDVYVVVYCRYCAHKNEKYIYDTPNCRENRQSFVAKLCAHDIEIKSHCSQIAITI